MPVHLTEDEARDILTEMKRYAGGYVLKKYAKKGYRSFDQLEREVIRVTGESWRERSTEEIDMFKKATDFEF